MPYIATAVWVGSQCGYIAKVKQCLEIVVSGMNTKNIMGVEWMKDLISGSAASDSPKKVPMRIPQILREAYMLTAL